VTAANSIGNTGGDHGWSLSNWMMKVKPSIILQICRAKVLEFGNFPA
jgi:hypothetical protein